MVNIKEKAGDVIEVSIIWDPRHKNHVGRYYPKPIPWEGITSRGITCLQNKHGRQIELAHQGLYRARIDKILERSIVVTYLEKIGEWNFGGGRKIYYQEHEQNGSVKAAAWGYTPGDEKGPVRTF